MSSWIKPCAHGLFNKDLLGHQFQVRFLKRKQNIFSTQLNTETTNRKSQNDIDPVQLMQLRQMMN